MASIIKFVFSYALVTIKQRIEHEHEYSKCPDECSKTYDVYIGEGEICYPIDCHDSNVWRIIGFQGKWYAVMEVPDTKRTRADFYVEYMPWGKYFVIEDTYSSKEAAEQSFRDAAKTW